MALKVVWTRQAEHGLEIVIHYLEDNWTVKEILNLEENLKEVLQLIVQNPKIFPVSKDGKLHKAVIDKNNYLIYRVNLAENQLEIIYFRGTKQKPLF